MPDSPLTPDQLARKARSEAILRAEGVPVLDVLPVIETEVLSNPRSKEEVARRAMCLTFVALKGEGMPGEEVEELVGSHNLREFLSPDESEFIFDLESDEEERMAYTWRYEALHVLLWALGYVTPLGRPTQLCDVPGEIVFLHDLGPDDFIERAVLRPASDILDEADLIYRTHWATRGASLQGEAPPAGLDEDVVMEWHHALNWLCRTAEGWDEISTDT